MAENVKPDGVVPSYDPYDAKYINECLKVTPNVIFRHPPEFTAEEDRIIAAGLYARLAVYRIAETIHCHRETLSKHIKETPELAAIVLAAKEREKEEVEEAIDDCIKRRVPAVIMWKAEKILADKYGGEKPPEEEDDSRIIIGDLSADMLAEGDAIIAEAASAPPDVGISALADPRVLAADASKLPRLEASPPPPAEAERRRALVNAGAEVSDRPLDQTLPAPALNPGDDPRFTQYQDAEPAVDEDDSFGGMELFDGGGWLDS